MVRSFCVIAALAALAFWPAIAQAQSDDDCFDCHDDQSLTKNESGQIISLFVDRNGYTGSIHGQNDLACTDCHDAIDDLPHETELGPVDCAVCHDDIAERYLMSLHGELVEQGAPLAPHCWDCHGAHAITPPENPLSAVNRFNIPFMCGRCHKGGNRGHRVLRHPPGQHTDPLLPQYPRRGAVPPRPDHLGRLHRLPHRTPSTAAYRPALDDSPR